MEKIINLTARVLNIMTENGNIVSVEPSGTVAHCSVTNTPVRVLSNGIVCYRTTCGEVIGLPAEEEGVMYVVSGSVRRAVPTRLDVVSPGEVVHIQDGQQVVRLGLSIN